MGLRPQFLRAAVVQHERAADHVRVDEPFVEPIPMQDDGWCGQLTLPREIMLVAESGSLTVTSLTLHHLKSIGLD